MVQRFLLVQFIQLPDVVHCPLNEINIIVVHNRFEEIKIISN